MLPWNENQERASLTELADALREATIAAMRRQSALARLLDEAREEVQRLLLVERHDPDERRRVVSRAQMILDTWQATSGVRRASVG